MEPTYCASLLFSSLLYSTRGKLGRGQDGLGTMGGDMDMVGGRRVSRNNSQPGWLVTGRKGVVG
jgi:hypothetical protein